MRSSNDSAPIAMPANRAAGRNVRFYDAKDPATVLGGLRLTPGVTNANFHAMLELVVVFAGAYVLRTQRDAVVPRDDGALLPGSYYIFASSMSPACAS